MDPVLARRFLRLSRICAASVGILGIVVLAGWILDIQFLKSLHPSLASMKANTALGFTLIGAALWSYLGHPPGEEWAARLLAAAVFLLGAATVLEYAIGFDFGIDQTLVRDRAGGPVPGRMPLATAIHFTSLGLAITLLDTRVGRNRQRPAEWLAILVGLSSLLSLLGYLYGVRSLYAFGPYETIALHTTIGFLIACVAVLFTRPRDGLVRLVSSASPGGMLARRMLPAAIFLPAALGWIRLEAQRRGYIGFEFGLALFAASNIVCFTALVLWNARALLRSDDARVRAEQAVRDSEENLDITLNSIGDGVVATDAVGRVVRMNPIAEALTGWPADEAAGRPCDEVVRLLDRDTRRVVASPAERALRGEGPPGVVLPTVLIARGGAERVVAERGAPIRDDAGSLRGAVLVLRDQTHEIQAERTLRESEARKAAVLDASFDCIVTMDHTGAILEFNRAAEETFGYRRADAIGRPLGDLLVPPALRDRHRQGLERYLATEKPAILGKRFEISAVRADGSEFPVEVGVARIHSDGPPMFTGFIRDITERRRVAEALRASESRFRRLFESGLIGIVVASERGDIQDANDAFLRMVGFSRDALEAGLLRWGDLAPPEWRARAQAAEPLGAQGSARPWEQELLCRDGTRVPVLLGVTQLDDSSTIAFALDLTERKRAEAAIRRLRRERAADAKFRALLEAAPDAMVIVDRDGLITLVNSRAEKVFGYGRDEILGKPIERLIAAGRLELDARRFDAPVELRGLRKDGSEFPVEVTVSPIDTEDGLLLSSAIRDISERKQTEQTLREANKAAEVAMAELEAFSYSVAHDLRSPLRAINGFASAVVEDWGDRLDEQAREHLSRISAGARRMGDLIDALLNLARVTRAGLRREPVSLSQVAAEVMAQLRASAPERTVELAIEEELMATGDPQLLRVLLENLLGNAWKFSERRTDARIEFGCARADEDVYYVRDNGAGFDMKYADKLFTPFQRLHPAGDFSGNGIGLATVQRIVRRHGGRIWAEAAVGAGASFHFTLPG